MRGEGWEAEERCRGKMEWKTWLGAGVGWYGDWGGMLPFLTVPVSELANRLLRRLRIIPNLFAYSRIVYLRSFLPFLS